MGSFGREVKDFISAFQAGDKIFGSQDDREYRRLRNQYMRTRIKDASDPETLQLKKDRIKASTELAKARMNRALRGPDPDLTESRRLNNELRRRQLKALDEPAPASPAAGDLGDYGTPPSATPGPQSAIDAGDEYDTAGFEPQGDAYDTADLQQDDEGGFDDEQFAAHGGMLRHRDAVKVKGYADGGIVDDDEDDYSSSMDTADDDEDDSADYEEGVSTSEAAPQQGAAPQTSAKGYSVMAAKDAVEAGINYARENADNDGTTELSAQSRRARAPGMGYYRGNGAASGTEMNAIRDAIKAKFPGMSDAELTMASLAHGYEWKLKQGDPKGAAALAGSMVQYYRQMSDRYKAIAQVAAENGDVNGSLKAIMKSYANTPDGVELKLARSENGALSYNFVDTASGKTIDKGIATPEQILQFASRSSMHNFDDVISRAKGETGQKAAPKGMSMRDYKSANDMMDKSAEDTEGVTPEGNKPAIDPEEATALKSAAKRIFVAPNNRQANVSPEDARGAVAMLADPTAKAGQSAAVEGGRMVKFGNNPPIFVPQAQFEQLAAIRTRKLMAAKDAEDKAAIEAKKPGVVGRGINAVTGAYRAGMDAAGNRKPRAAEGPVEHPARFPIPGVTYRPPLRDDEIDDTAYPSRGLGER